MKNSCGDGNKAAFRRIVKRGAEPGLLAYDGDTPVGWCAISPREEYGGLARSRILKPVDDQPVWSITCFYVARAYRRMEWQVGVFLAEDLYVGIFGIAHGVLSVLSMSFILESIQ